MEESDRRAGCPRPCGTASELGRMRQPGELTIPRFRAPSLTWLPGLVVAAAAFAVVFGVGSTEGGYFPTAWGWTALALSWAAGVALVIRPEIRYGPLEPLACSALASFTLWIALSTAWTQSASRTVLEFERALVYVAAIIALSVVVRSITLRHLLGGTLAAIALLCSYALATRLFPERLGSFDPVSTYRLGEPIGYWNALGIVAAIGILLAVGTAARGKHLLSRSLAGVSLMVLLPTLLFTYSRGAWIALFLGLAAQILVDRRRLQLVTTMLIVGLPAVLALWLASRSSALTSRVPVLKEATAQGHRLALVIVALAILAGVMSWLLTVAEDRLDFSIGARHAYAAVLIAALTVGLGAAFARYGSPVTMARTAYEDFTSSSKPRAGSSSLNTRLFSLWGNGRPQMWKVAWNDWRGDPWLGSGAGTYEELWGQHRPFASKVRDAHSLYAETLAELGAPGLALLLAALAVPLVAARRARSHPLGAVAFAAYIAFLFHIGVDWDWEMPIVIVSGLFCGGAILIAARRANVRTMSTRVRAGTLALVLAISALTIVATVGNNALATGASAADEHRWRDSEAEARKAMGWMPWSSDPWQMVGEAQLARGRRAAARASFRKAISKDRRDWELWVDLALASPQPARRRAALVALRLNPLSPEIAQSRQLLGLGP
jgi:O-antigen ligase